MNAKKFIEILREAAQTHEMTVRRYSGRAMYGRQCVAVTTEKEYSAIAAITAEIAWTDDDDLMRDWVELLADTRSDSMGRYDVVLYWPELERPADVAESADEDELDEEDLENAEAERLDKIARRK